MTDRTETSTGGDWLDRPTRRDRLTWALCLAWSLEEPGRVGEVAWLGRAGVLGRGAEGSGPRIGFVRARPGGEVPTGALAARRLSRDQLAFVATDGRLEVERRGRRALRVNGAVRDHAVLVAGDVIEVDRVAVFLVQRRTRRMPGGRLRHGFGGPDGWGLVGEGPALADLRVQLEMAAATGAHVLVTGPSGVGKELVARALHGASARRDGPFVARNAATLPAGLVDAELFGNVRNYPNPGMAERPGLVGQADGGTLFLDELGELPAEVQAHLLRVLDAGGEYHRLGDATSRRADLRLVAATNRDPAELKLDLRMRLGLHLEVPGLGDRREDVPLLVRHLLLRRDPSVVDRFCERGVPRVTPGLMTALLRHRWTGHVRELDALLWAALVNATDDVIRRVPAVDDRLDLPVAAAAVAPDDVEPAAIVAALDAHGGNVTSTARALGLGSRYVLYRLMKRHGIATA